MKSQGTYLDALDTIHTSGLHQRCDILHLGSPNGCPAGDGRLEMEVPPLAEESNPDLSSLQLFCGYLRLFSGIYGYLQVFYCV